MQGELGEHKRKLTGEPHRKKGSDRYSGRKFAGEVLSGFLFGREANEEGKKSQMEAKRLGKEHDQVIR